MRISSTSDRTQVMRTQCERCSLEGYIFPDQLQRGESYAIGDRYWSKCCNGRREKDKSSKCLYFINPDRAHRLQKIRMRKTTINKDDAVSNF